MGALIFNSPVLVNPFSNRNGVCRFGEIELQRVKFQFSRHQKVRFRFSEFRRNYSYSSGQSYDGDDPQDSVEELRVPEHWLEPSKASEESEWLRVMLHKWLDEEYCPEATNIEISKVAAKSFYNSLLEKRADLGEILLQMAVELESISYQESFHGAFSSANAAVNLIVQRISQE
ncbi:hypothetical protein BUALT_Bualt13G0007900 [Buddleja alternifolia]|uniref:Uncharacterized protein n=1 Tax=Buddleja alternifolia TaxID=168488 RepID=A0AAV6WUI2_9LAMI|nr:hypothetical protein BUALT_Bualt13G0007900 [Buddleja alternifolia]